MSKKTEKENPKYYIKEHKVLYEDENSNVDKLFELYKKDKFKARVIYMNNTTNYEKKKIMLFKEKNGDFSIVVFRKKHGISTTNKMWTAEKRMKTITYTKKKFWLINNFYRKQVSQLTLNNLRMCCEGGEYGIIINTLSDRFTWLKFMEEKHILKAVALNSVVKNKLFSFKKAIQFKYKVPYPIGKILHENISKVAFIDRFIYYHKFVKNIEALKTEWLTDYTARGIFIDSLHMAKTVDKQINCSWSIKRLKEEHDKWAAIISDIVYIDGNRDLNIADLYIQFAEYSGYELITTTKDLAFEGKRQNHCVASYVSKIDNGNCGIYRVGEHTLEMSTFYSGVNKGIKCTQFRGYANVSAPEELKLNITEIILRFNAEVLDIEMPTEELKLSTDAFDMDWLELDQPAAVELHVNNNDLPF